MLHLIAINFDFVFFILFSTERLFKKKIYVKFFNKIKKNLILFPLPGIMYVNM
jgi:hypothetical protein